MMKASSRGFYGISLLLGIVTLAEFVLVFLPKLHPLAHLLDALEIYLAKIHPSLTSQMGGGLLPQLALGGILGWLAAFAAVEAFSRRSDGVSLWRNIADDSCGRKAAGLPRWLCATTKWLATVAAGPLLIVWAMVARLRSRTQFVTVGFITVDPGVVLEYVKHVLVGTALVVAVAVFFLGTPKSPATGSFRAIDPALLSWSLRPGEIIRYG